MPVSHAEGKGLFTDENGLHGMRGNNENEQLSSKVHFTGKRGQSY